MGNLVKGLLGGTKPKVSAAPTEDTEAAKRKAKKSRVALFETEGGVAGEELDPSGLTQRSTLLGN